MASVWAVKPAFSCGGTAPVVILCEVFRRRPGSVAFQGPYKVGFGECNAKFDAFNDFLKDGAIGLFRWTGLMALGIVHRLAAWS